MAERVGKAVLELGLDAAVLLAGLEQVKASSRSTDSEFEKLRQKSIQAGRDLSKMVEGFRGDAIVAEARRTAQAVEQVGGVSKLTSREVKDVAATVAAATEKMKRMGDEVPPSLRKLSGELASLDAASKKSGGGLSSLGGIASTLGPLLPIASLAGATAALTRMATAAFDDAGALIDMSNATGLSTDSLQEMRAVADQTGTSLEAFTGNAFKLGINVADGADKARKAASDLGIEWARLASASPDEQFRMVVTALEGVDNAQERNRIGTALFGKQFKEIAASVAEGYGGIADAAGKSSRAQLESLDRAGDAWSRFLTGTKTETVKVLGGVVMYFEDTFSAITLNIEKYSSLQQQRIREVQGQGGEGLAAILRGFDTPAKDIDLSSATDGVEDYTQALAEAKSEVAALHTAERAGDRAQLTAAIALGGDAAQDYADKIHLSGTALRLFSSETKPAKKGTDELVTAQESLFGQDVIANATTMVIALGDVGNVSKLTAEKKIELNRTVTNAIEVYKLLGQTAPPVLLAIAAATTPLLASTMRFDGALVALKGTVTSAGEELAKTGGALSDLASGSLHETAVATTAADAAMRAWANTTGAVYPPAVRQASSANQEFTESTFDAYSALAQMFSQLGQISGPDGLGGFMRAAGNVVVGMQGARAQAKLVGQDGQILGGRFGALSTVFNANATSSQKMAAGLASAAGVAQGAANIWNATGQSASKLQNSLSGAMAGAQAGAMFGPWGIAVGAAAGLVVGIVRGKPAWAKAAQEVGRDFGENISKELGQKIADLAKKDFRGNRQAAATASIGDIIKESGGLNPENLDKFTAKLRDVFALIEGGQMTAAQGTKVLDENWAAFVQAGTDGQGRLSSGLKDIIRLQQRMGVESKQITAYLKEQAAVIASGSNATIAASQTQIDQWVKVADAAKAAAEAKRAADATGQGSPELDKALTTANAALAAQRLSAGQFRQELDDLSLIAAGAYHAAIAAGQTHAQAMAAAGPGLANLKAAYDALGIAVDDAATKSLMMQAEIQQRNPALIGGIAGLTQSMIALDNSGRMNAETFAAMQRRGMAMFTRIQAAAAAAGADMSTNAEALLPMQEYLREAARQATLLGIPLDANTQMLIDQSKELGIWKDSGEKAADPLIAGLGEVVTSLKDIANALRGIPPVVNTRINVERNTTDTSSGSPPSAPGFRHGVFRGRFSESGSRAILHGVESVVPRDQETAFVDRVIGERGGMSTPPVETTTNTTNLLPVLFAQNMPPSEIGHHAAAWLVSHGLKSNMHGITSAIERVVDDRLRTRGNR